MFYIIYLQQSLEMIINSKIFAQIFGEEHTHISNSYWVQSRMQEKRDAIPALQRSHLLFLLYKEFNKVDLSVSGD